MISFEINSNNQLLLNPRLPANELKNFKLLQEAFENKYNNSNYFLIPSSGSSRQEQQSAKLIALKIESILNSARRVNFYLNASASDHWGLALPDFHVAGLGVKARAFLAGSSVYSLNWDPSNIATQITKYKISFLSLVPTLVFDLVQANVLAPSCLKKVFVGGGMLNKTLLAKINNLGWPVVETYGMTETASMIAIREKDCEYYEVMPNVLIAKNDSGVAIGCNSLLTASLQLNDGVVEIKNYTDKDHFSCEDLVEIKNDNSRIFIKLLGRKTDYIKILGEGVSLSELRTHIENITHELKLNASHFEIYPELDLRNGYKLKLIVEQIENLKFAKMVFEKYNALARPYERLAEIVQVSKIPRSELGKLKLEELRSMLNVNDNKG